MTGLIPAFINTKMVCFQIGVIGLSNKPIYPRSDPCLPHTLVPATFETRIYFSKFIDSLEKQDSKLLCCVLFCYRSVRLWELQWRYLVVWWFIAQYFTSNNNFVYFNVCILFRFLCVCVCVCTRAQTDDFFLLNSIITMCSCSFANVWTKSMGKSQTF